MSACTSSEAARVRKRRRTMVLLGALAVTTFAVTGLLLGTGCIFDSGGYDGGGQRSSIPVESPTASNSEDPGKGPEADEQPDPDEDPDKPKKDAAK